MRFLIVCLAIVAFVGSAHAENRAETANAFLDALTGEWTMAGTVRGEPVQYTLHCARVLQGGFIRLSMVDVQSPPQYEADVYIGYDEKAGDFIAHWLDRFGAAGSRVVANGRLKDGKLVLTFPYEGGAFRNTYAFDEASGRWSLLIEAQGKGEKWSTFAKYSAAPR